MIVATLRTYATLSPLGPTDGCGSADAAATGAARTAAAGAAVAGALLLCCFKNSLASSSQPISGFPTLVLSSFVSSLLDLSTCSCFGSRVLKCSPGCQTVLTFSVTFSSDLSSWPFFVSSQCSLDFQTLVLPFSASFFVLKILLPMFHTFPTISATFCRNCLSKRSVLSINSPSLVTCATSFSFSSCCFSPLLLLILVWHLTSLATFQERSSCSSKEDSSSSDTS